MSGDALAPAEAALQRLAQLADELLELDSSGEVRLSVERLRVAFVDRNQLEPAVDGVVRSVQHLASRGRSWREAHNAEEVDRLNAALQVQVLPALRRIGFEV